MSWIRQKKGLECLVAGGMTDAGSVEMSIRMCEQEQQERNGKFVP